ncbi:MAG: hypothetical protein WDW36_003412 [Sanguina aurantia]
MASFASVGPVSAGVDGGGAVPWLAMGPGVDSRARAGPQGPALAMPVGSARPHERPARAGAGPAGAAATRTGPWRRWRRAAEGVRRLGLRLLPPARVQARFEFMFEDMLGEAPGYQRTTITAWILMGTAVNITHKTLCALVIGLYGFEPHSWTQLVLVICLQGALLAYLCLVKPYLSRGLQLLEVVCHASEMVVFLGAAASLHWEASPAVTYVMLGAARRASRPWPRACAHLVKVVAALRLCWNALRTWLATQWHSHPRPTDEAILHAQQPEYEEGLHRQGSVPASVTRLPSKSLPHRRASQVVGPSSVTSMHEPQKISFDCPHWEEGNE